METVTEKIDVVVNERLKELRGNQIEILKTIGQIHMDMKELYSSLCLYESEYKSVSDELFSKLKELEKQYPNGEIDLVDGTVTYTK